MPNPSQVNWQGLQHLNPQDAKTGRVPISDNDPLRATYGFNSVNFATVAANPTDVCTLFGAANKIIRLRQIQVSGIAGTNTTLPMSIIKRSTLNTGGTVALTQAGVPVDSLNDPSIATVRLYSANPTLGNSVGAIDGGRLVLSTGAGSQLDRFLYQYSWLNDQSPTIRGAAESININFGGNAWPGGGALDFTLRWTEEDV